jgi:chromosome segregation ATPase
MLFLTPARVVRALAALLCALLAFWAMLERSRRTETEAEAKALTTRLGTATREKAAAETERDRQAANAREALGRFQEAARVSAKDVLDHRNRVDALLSEIAILTARAEQLEGQFARRHAGEEERAAADARREADLARLRAALREEQARAEVASKALRQHAVAAARETRRTHGAIEKARGDLSDLTEALDASSEALGKVGEENERLAADCREALAQREAAFSALRDAQLAATDCERRLRSREVSILALQRTIDGLLTAREGPSAELCRLRQDNKRLLEQVQALNAEIARLQRLLCRPSGPAVPPKPPGSRKSEQDLAER